MLIAFVTVHISMEEDISLYFEKTYLTKTTFNDHRW